MMGDLPSEKPVEVDGEIGLGFERQASKDELFILIMFSH